MSSTSDKQARPLPASTQGALDASCRWPVMVLFTGGAGWLVLSTLLGFLATMKFHMPGMFANCPFFSYGRLVASSQSLLIYGFGVSVALGICLWLTTRLSKTPMVGGVTAIIAAHGWHTGVLVMWVTLAMGGLTGHEGFEVPKASALILLVSYVALVVPVLRTLAARTDKHMEPAQWFVLAALFWFAWIFATASYFIHWQPVRGIIQVAVQYWYGHNLVWIFFGSVALGVIHHLLPVFAGRELFSRELAAFTFWVSLLIGSLGGVPHGVPLPAWLSSVGGVSAALMLIPVAATAYNAYMTLGGNFGKLGEDVVRSFVMLGAGLYVVAAVASVMHAMRPFGDMVGLTLYAPALAKLMLHGFIGMTFFGAVLMIAPAVAGEPLPVSKLVKIQFMATLSGSMLLVIVLGTGGILTGAWGLDGPGGRTPEEILMVTRRFLQMSSLGDLLLIAGHACLLINLKLLCYRLCRACCASGCCGDSPVAKTAEATA